MTQEGSGAVANVAQVLSDRSASAEEHRGVLAERVRKINYSSAGHGGTGHLTGELPTRAGIEMVHVSYKAAVQDLLGGQIQMVVTALPTVEGHLKSGKLRALAFTSRVRVPGAPDVPTLAESGYAGFEVLSWYGILAPAGTPQDVVRKLNEEINNALKMPDVRGRLLALGTEPTGGTPEQFAETIKADTVRWARYWRCGYPHRQPE